jgi:signal transduction histidine kinase
VNAAHSINEHGTITIRTGHDESTVWVEIQDTGQGIKPENLPRIFDPFFSTKPVGKGTGLGLSIAYGIVKKHNGSIAVQSELGVGTRFKVTLPIKAASPVA